MVKRILIVLAVLALLALIIWSATRPVKIEDPLPKAIALLELNHVPVPQHKIVLRDKAPSNASPDVAAWVYTEGDGTIFVLTTTEVWQRASEGDEEYIVNLASVLVHEGVHADGDPNEMDAYDAQIAALERMDAPKNLIDGVIAARRRITNTLR